MALEVCLGDDPKRRIEPDLVAFRGAEIPDRVVAVASVEDEYVGFCAAVQVVKAGAAADGVGSDLTEERVVVSPAQDDVVAGAALGVVVTGVAVDRVIAVEAPKAIVAVAAIQG